MIESKVKSNTDSEIQIKISGSMVDVTMELIAILSRLSESEEGSLVILNAVKHLAMEEEDAL